VRKGISAPGWLAALNARFGVAALEIQPNVADMPFRTRSCKLITVRYEKVLSDTLRDY